MGIREHSKIENEIVFNSYAESGTCMFQQCIQLFAHVLCYKLEILLSVLTWKISGMLAPPFIMRVIPSSK